MSAAREAVASAAASEFYRARLAAVATSDWEKIPYTSRADLVADQLRHLPFGSRRTAAAATPIRVGICGSGDDLLVLPWSEHDLALEKAAGTRLLGACGVAAGAAVANTLPGALVSPGSLLFGDVVEAHGALDVPLGAIESDAAAKQAWELVERVHPSVLVLESATADRFFAAAPPAARPWLDGLIWLWRGRGGGGEVPAAVGFSGWQRRWLAIAEVASFVAASCAAGPFHADESIIIEAAPSSSALVLTPVGGENALLRYDCGLPVRLIERCACGGGPSFEIL